jgi:hypothetical protein
VIVERYLGLRSDRDRRIIGDAVLAVNVRTEVRSARRKENGGRFVSDLSIISANLVDESSG